MDRGSRRQGIALLVITLGSIVFIVVGSLTGLGDPGELLATPRASPALVSPGTPPAAP